VCVRDNEYVCVYVYVYVSECVCAYAALMQEVVTRVWPSPAPRASYPSSNPTHNRNRNSSSSNNNNSSNNSIPDWWARGRRERY
jgi:hypothetical protein